MGHLVDGRMGPHLEALALRSRYWKDPEEPSRTFSLLFSWALRIALRLTREKRLDGEEELRSNLRKVERFHPHSHQLLNFHIIHYLFAESD